MTAVRSTILSPDMCPVALQALIPPFVYNYREEIKTYILQSMEGKVN